MSKESEVSAETLTPLPSLTSEGEGSGEGKSSVTFEPTDWEERLKAAVEKTLQQRAVKRAERAQFKRNRDFGLAKRHAKKLRDNRQEKLMETTTTPDPEQLAAAKHLIKRWVDAGYLIRMTDGRLIEADRYDPLYHGPKDEIDE